MVFVCFWAGLVFFGMFSGEMNDWDVYRNRWGERVCNVTFTNELWYLEIWVFCIEVAVAFHFGDFLISVGNSKNKRFHTK